MGKSSDHDSHLTVSEGIEAIVFKEKAKERIVKENTAIGKIYDSELTAVGVNEAAVALIFCLTRPVNIRIIHIFSFVT